MAFLKIQKYSSCYVFAWGSSIYKYYEVFCCYFPLQLNSIATNSPWITRSTFKSLLGISSYIHSFILWAPLPNEYFVPDVKCARRLSYMQFSWKTGTFTTPVLGEGKCRWGVIFGSLVGPASTWDLHRGVGRWHLIFPLPQLRDTLHHLAGNQSKTKLLRAQRIPPWTLQKLDPKRSWQSFATWPSTSPWDTQGVALGAAGWLALGWRFTWAPCRALSITQGEASQEQHAALLCSLLLKGKARTESQVQHDCSSSCGFVLFLQEAVFLSYTLMVFFPF